MVLWSLPLFPLPLLLAKLGIGFIILVTLLNVGALILAINDFTQKIIWNGQKNVQLFTRPILYPWSSLPFLFNFNSRV